MTLVNENHDDITKVAEVEKILLEGSSLEAIDDETWLWMHTEGYQKSSVIQDFIPPIPSDNTQFVFNGKTNRAKNLAHGFQIYKLVKQFAEQYVGSLSSLDGILDFGCGWGRIIRFFCKDMAPSKLWGIDVNKSAIATCQATLPELNFRVVNFQPPSNLAKQSFDIIFANSVFSHLSEDAHLQWINEFKALLKPGGLIVLTTWDRDFILRCQKARDGLLQNRDPKRIERLSQIFVDVDQALNLYDSGEYCYEKGLPGQPEGFGNTCISKQYIQTQWPRIWSLVDFIDDQTRFPQAVIIAQRK